MFLCRDWKVFITVVVVIIIIIIVVVVVVVSEYFDTVPGCGLSFQKLLLMMRFQHAEYEAGEDATSIM